MLQGTLYPDVIESCPPPGSGQKHSHTIKSHHNVGGLPKDLDFALIEPLRELFKVPSYSFSLLHDSSIYLLTRSLARSVTHLLTKRPFTHLATQPLFAFAAGSCMHMDPFSCFMTVPADKGLVPASYVQPSFHQLPPLWLMHQ